MVHDEGAEVLRVVQRIAHDARIGDRGLAIREGHGAGALQEADLGQFLTLEAFGQRRDDVHMDDGPLARAALHVVDQRYLIDDRLGIRHAHDGRDAARCRGKARGLEGFAMLLAGIARIDLRVDEPGAENVSVAVDDRRPGWRIAAQMSADVRDHAICDQQPAGLIAPRCRIDDACIDEDGAGGGIRTCFCSIPASWWPHALTSFLIGRATRHVSGSADGALGLPAPPCGRQHPSRPARGSHCASGRRSAKRSRHRGSSGPDA